MKNLRTATNTLLTMVEKEMYGWLTKNKVEWKDLNQKYVIDMEIVNKELDNGFIEQRKYSLIELKTQKLVDELLIETKATFTLS